MISITAFDDKYMQKNESGQPFKLVPHQREVDDLIFKLYLADAWNTYVEGLIKKSAKTTRAAKKMLWWAFTHPNDELLIAANDFEQGKGRVFKVMVGLIRHNA